MNNINMDEENKDDVDLNRSQPVIANDEREAPSRKSWKIENMDKYNNADDVGVIEYKNTSGL